jgi:O-succinylbenzoic acid--CoA ligase
MEQLARRLRKSLPSLPEISILESNPFILLEADPLRFWSSLISAIEIGNSIAVLSPEWPQDWLKQLRELASRYTPENPQSLLIPTSGSSGIPKFCIHNADTIQSATDGFNNFATSKGIRHNINVLPQHHAGGLLPVFRSAACDGMTHFADYLDIEKLMKVPFELNESCISVVPTQLRRMLGDQDLCGFLQSMGMVLVGGAACSEGLLKEARRKGIRLAPCYGSTETAAMVTILDPDAFLDGASGVGKPLSGAGISLAEDGRIQVHSDANCRGYWPQDMEFNREPLQTNDLGELDKSGNLRILGRADRIIITGGEKVIPEVVEAAAQASGLVAEAYCFGSPDPVWGMRVELEFTSVRNGPGLEARLEAWLKDWIPPYAVPKSIVLVDNMHTDAMGKSKQKTDS